MTQKYQKYKFNTKTFVLRKRPEVPGTNKKRACRI